MWIIIGAIIISTISVTTFSALFLNEESYQDSPEPVYTPKPGDKYYIEPSKRAKLEEAELDIRAGITELHQKNNIKTGYAVNLNPLTQEIEIVVQTEELNFEIEKIISQYSDEISISFTTGVIHLIDEFENPQTSTNYNLDELDIISANNQFAIDFYSKIKDQDENIFFSPYSISSAFAIVNEGAQGETSKEIFDVFGFPEDEDKRRIEFSMISNSLNKEDENFNLKVANALWIADRYNLKQEYVENAKKHYDSEVSTVNFVSDEGVDKINTWVEEKTEKKIKNILQPGSTNELTVFAVTNAIYFKGTWVTQFDEKKTREMKFWLDNNENVNAQMMNLNPTEFSHAQFENFQMLQLPYKGERLSMMILLPNQLDGLSSIEESISIKKLKDWTDKLNPRKIIVSVPKFKLETDYDLYKSLPQMGMPLAFSEKADFTGMIEPKGVYIQQAIHKAFVDVNEEGTEAAAATAVSGGFQSGGPTYPQFIADHPFMFLIQDNESGAILFLGRVMNPN